MHSVGSREQFHGCWGHWNKPGGNLPCQGWEAHLPSPAPLSQSIPWLSHPLVAEPRSQQHLAHSRAIHQAREPFPSRTQTRQRPRSCPRMSGIVSCWHLECFNCTSLLTATEIPAQFPPGLWCSLEISSKNHALSNVWKLIWAECKERDFIPKTTETSTLHKYTK